MQENSQRWFKELRNKINEQKEYFTKEIGTLKQNQTEILATKNAINEMKNKVGNIKNRADYMEERIMELKYGNLEMMQVELERELRFFKMYKLYRNYITPIERAT